MTKRILAAALALTSAGAFAQTYATLTGTAVDGIMTSATPYTQNFDTLGNATTIPTAPSGNVGALNSGPDALDGLFVSGATPGDVPIANNAGSSTGGGIYNFSNSQTSTDRALGGLLSASFAPKIGLRIRNATGGATPLLGIDFTLEQYRRQTAANTLTLQYRLVAPATTDTEFQSLLANDAGWLSSHIAGLQRRGDQTTETAFSGVVTFPTTGASNFVNGNTAVNQVLVRTEIDLGKIGSGADAVRWEDGQDFAFRWVQNDIPNSADGAFGLDNIRVVPEPASMAALALGFGAIVAGRRRKSA